MKITIIGAGNIGTQFAIEFAEKGHDVTIFASKPSCIKKNLFMVNEVGETTKKGEVKKITNNIKDAVEDAEYIIITYPAFMLKDIADRLFDYVEAGMKIGVIPGTGGAEFFFARHVKKGAVLFGLQRVPGVARLETYGECVRVSGKRERLHLAVIPKCMSTEIANVMESVFEMPCEILPNYLCVTLTPSNPILHTTRLKTLFEEYVPGRVYEKNPLFYQEWTDKSSELLLRCDSELQEICKTLKALDLSEVRSLKLHYESTNVKEMTQKLRSIKSLQGLYTPMLKVEGGYIPDFNSRYFTADFPYGLSIIAQLAKVLSVDVQYIKETLDWYYSVTGRREEVHLSEYGICSYEAVIEFYREKEIYNNKEE